jgi:hypothetical protein
MTPLTLWRSPPEVKTIGEWLGDPVVSQIFAVSSKSLEIATPIIRGIIMDKERKDLALLEKMKIFTALTCSKSQFKKRNFGMIPKKSYDTSASESSEAEEKEVDHEVIPGSIKDDKGKEKEIPSLPEKVKPKN